MSDDDLRRRIFVTRYSRADETVWHDNSWRVGADLWPKIRALRSPDGRPLTIDPEFDVMLPDSPRMLIGCPVELVEGDELTLLTPNRVVQSNNQEGGSR